MRHSLVCTGVHMRCYRTQLVHCVFSHSHSKDAMTTFSRSIMGCKSTTTSMSRGNCKKKVASTRLSVQSQVAIQQSPRSTTRLSVFILTLLPDCENVNVLDKHDQATEAFFLESLHHLAIADLVEKGQWRLPVLNAPPWPVTSRGLMRARKACRLPWNHCCNCSRASSLK